MDYRQYNREDSSDEDDDSILLENNDIHVAENVLRYAKSDIENSSTLPCSLRCKIGCVRSVTNERFLWICTVVSICVMLIVSSIFVINFLQSELTHGLTSGICVITNCSLVDDPRQFSRVLKYVDFELPSVTKCCCNIDFTPQIYGDDGKIDPSQNTTSVHTCDFGEYFCHAPIVGDSNAVKKPISKDQCFKNPDNQFWKNGPPNLWIIKLLTILGIILLGCLIIVIMLGCTEPVPVELLPIGIQTLLNGERQYQQYSLNIVESMM